MIEDKKNHWEKEYNYLIKHKSNNNTNNLPWDIKKHDKNLEEVLNVYDIKKGKILEIGCGTGNDINFLCKKGFDVTGMDISEEAINISIKNNNFKNVKFIVGDINSDLPNEKFDIIYDRGCLHGNPELIENIFFKFEKILNNYGKIIIISSNSNSKGNDYATPPLLNMKELILHSDKFFRIKLIKEIHFELSEGYENVLGYLIVLEKNN